MPTALYLLNILLIVSVSIYTLLILFHIISWLSIKQPVKQHEPFKTSVSIIIAARNEEKDIASCIKSILAQDYPASLLEIIVCNDHSEDKTKEVAENVVRQFDLAEQNIRDVDAAGDLAYGTPVFTVKGHNVPRG